MVYRSKRPYERRKTTDHRLHPSLGITDDPNRISMQYVTEEIGYLYRRRSGM